MAPGARAGRPSRHISRSRRSTVKYGTVVQNRVRPSPIETLTWKTRKWMGAEWAPKLSREASSI